eukprot:CAMPEP_0168417948 /NCGR_PEP_ID=MMETSP0228-20121227/31514_1 /TAXON_ID=133427 /ORGANISM="Protoceratium reticulatum, Strain CCCM 535 (=CCMP 1889)" /LENGTH=77 /DNA_ID=CAMNT_0008431811 /DNA_START=37 /DNA_END=267 /DNA_ORIENTATION=+
MSTALGLTQARLHVACSGASRLAKADWSWSAQRTDQLAVHKGWHACRQSVCFSTDINADRSTGMFGHDCKAHVTWTK